LDHYLEFWYRYYIKNSHPDSPEASDVVTFNTKQVDTFLNYNGDGKIWKMSWTQTPNLTTIE